MSASTPNRPGLLVSVRSAAEAEAALAGGAGLIDVKEPARGALGRADAQVIAEVRRVVAGRVPVSAAMGELVDTPLCSATARLGDGLAFAKWGLAGCGERPRWRAELLALRDVVEGTGPAVVAVAYADWQRASAPPPAMVAALAVEARFAAFLLDTCRKDGTTLLDWLSFEEVKDLAAACRSVGVAVALAGALGREQIARLESAAPDWFAVRSAACHGGDRRQTIDAERVRELVALLGERWV